MATNPPPIIRSSKPFSVEVPEGSNSAKARRSDIVANDEINATQKTYNFFDANHESESGVQNERLNDVNQSADFQHEVSHGENGLIQETAEDAAQNIFSEDPSDEIRNLQQVHEDKDGVNKALIPDSDHLSANDGLMLKEDTLKDRLAGEPTTDALKDRFAVETESLTDNNLQAIDADHQKANLQQLDDAFHDSKIQGLSPDKTRDNTASINNDSLKDQVSGQAASALHDHSAAINGESYSQNQQSVPDADVHDNLQSLPKDKLTDNLASIDQASIHDNTQALADSTLSDNHQGTLDEGFTDNTQGVDNPSYQNNQQGIADDVFESHEASTDKAHVHDHIELLPDTTRYLKDGPKPTAHIIDSSVNQQTDTTSLEKASSPGQEASTQHTAVHAHHIPTNAERKLEHEKRQEEFHGRIDALRKSVSGINHILDELEEKKFTPKS